MGRSSAVTDPARKKEYWEDDFEAIKNKKSARGRLKNSRLAICAWAAWWLAITAKKRSGVAVPALCSRHCIGRRISSVSPAENTTKVSGSNTNPYNH